MPVFSLYGDPHGAPGEGGAVKPGTQALGARKAPLQARPPTPPPQVTQRASISARPCPSSGEFLRTPPLHPQGPSPADKSLSCWPLHCQVRQQHLLGLQGLAQRMRSRGQQCTCPSAASHAALAGSCPRRLVSRAALPWPLHPFQHVWAQSPA